VVEMFEICPLEWRYGSEEMRKLFSRENITSTRLKVEVALAQGLSRAGIIPSWIPEKLEKTVEKVKIERIDELEGKLGHDIMAMVMSLVEVSGEAGKYVHLGATSYDIVDTAWAIIMRDALKIVQRKTVKIIRTLIDYAEKYKETLMIGRTHGQHALPITLGFKFANYVYEISRSLERINESTKRVIRGKISGAVGTMAAWGNRGFIVEEETLRMFNLKPHQISTQIAPRDGFAEIICNLAILGSQLDRLALEVRELMRPEIDEIAEGVGRRVGSSTMPQKRNPVTAEKISGLAKVLRSQVLIALENIPLWHERDLTNSSSERFLLPHSFIVIDEILDSTIRLLKNLIIKPDKMRKNIEITGGRVMAEAIMIKLVEKGLARHKAHEILREITRKAEERNIHLLEALVEDERISRYMNRGEIEDALKPENYLGEIEKIIERTVKYAEKIIGNVR